MRQFTHDLVSTLAEFVPRLLGAAVVLLVALVVALLLRRLTVRLLESLFQRTGAANSLSRLGYEGSPSRLIGTVLFWGIMLTGVAGAIGVLGLPSLEGTMDQIINLSGRVLVALAILIAGVMSAGWLAELAARQAERAELRGTNAFRRIVFIAIIVIAALLAADQLGLQTYVIVLATLGLVTAIALGQGLVLLSGNIAAGRYVQDGTTVGDVISVNGVEGTVEELGYASVTVRSEDGYLYRIPNRTLLENVVGKRE